MLKGLNGQSALIPPVKYNAKCQVNLYVDCPLSSLDNVIPMKACSIKEQIIAK